MQNIQATRTTLCAKCKQPCDRLPQRYCRQCHAENMRAKRPRYAELSAEQKLRANARSTAYQALKRGRLARQGCERCSDPKAQMHHDDYSQPLAVRWLCRACHARHHAVMG